MRVVFGLILPESIQLIPFPVRITDGFLLFDDRKFRKLIIINLVFLSLQFLPSDKRNLEKLGLILKRVRIMIRQLYVNMDLQIHKYYEWINTTTKGLKKKKDNCGLAGFYMYSRIYSSKYTEYRIKTIAKNKWERERRKFHNHFTYSL